MSINLKKSEVADIKEKVQNAFNNLAKVKRDEAFEDLIEVMVFFRGLDHDADDDTAKPVAPKAA